MYNGCKTLPLTIESVLLYNHKTVVRVSRLKEDYTMTDNEKELLRIIRGSDNPTKAIEVATKIILEFLKQDEPSQERPVA